MKLIAQVKLQPTEEQAQALKETLEAANAACNWLSDRAWESRVFGQWSLHKAFYPEIRSRFGLSAQVTVRVIAKVADAYKLDERSKRTFRPHGSIAYDDRILSWWTKASRVSVMTLYGREMIPFVCGDRQRRLLDSRQGETDLVYREGEWYLLAVCNVVEPDPEDVDDVLGVDLGIKNLAVDSDGNVHSGAVVNALRHRHRRLRRRLQTKRTASARRLLRHRRRKERRFAADVNHCISKRIVTLCEGTKRAMALEDLTGIRDRTTVRHTQRASHSSWSFGQLRAFAAHADHNAADLSHKS